MDTEEQLELTGCVDPDGRAVVGISLTNHRGKFCWMHATKYAEFLLEFGGPHPFYLNGFKGYLYVRCTPPGADKAINIAKWVVGKQPGTAITYADGDRCNLRRQNLIVNRGGWGITSKNKRTRADALAGGTHSQRSISTTT